LDVSDCFHFLQEAESMEEKGISEVSSTSSDFPEPRKAASQSNDDVSDMLAEAREAGTGAGSIAAGQHDIRHLQACNGPSAGAHAADAGVSAEEPQRPLQDTPDALSGMAAGGLVEDVTEVRNTGNGAPILHAEDSCVIGS
jgi:hypothetical protein